MSPDSATRFRQFQGLKWLFVRSVILLLPTVVLGTCCLPSTATAQPPGGMPPAPIVVAKVRTVTQAASKSFVGSLVPVRTSIVGSAEAGRVVEMHFDEGELVDMEPVSSGSRQQLGQPLVQLRTNLLKIEIEAAEVELSSREQAQRELSISLPADIEAAEAELQEVNARLKYSEENYQRLRELAESGGGMSRREVDEAFSIFRSQTELASAADKRLKKLTATRASQLAQARLAVEAQQAEIRRLHEKLEEYTIRAPFPGIVSQQLVELGQWVRQGDAVMEIIQLDPIELVVPVPQTFIQQLQVSIDQAKSNGTRLTTRVSVESVADMIEGEVIQIIPQADLRSRSFPVRIRINNPATRTESGQLLGHRLKAGMLATASMFIGAEEEMLLVPKDALVLGGRQDSLFVVQTDPRTQATTAAVVPVQVGAAIEDWIQVSGGGLNAGDQVVVEGNERLMAGQDVSIIKEISTDPDGGSSPGNTPNTP